MESNKSISQKFILTKFHFLQFQKWPKINFEVGKSLKLPKMQFHEWFFFSWIFFSDNYFNCENAQNLFQAPKKLNDLCSCFLFQIVTNFQNTIFQRENNIHAAY